VTGPPPDQPFPRDLLAGDTLDAARALLGAQLIRLPATPGEPQRVVRIVEVEAYIGPDDRASHARMGPTARNGVMFGPPGVAYVYLVYGMHHCLNVVTGPDGFPAAVLIRAVEPLAGLTAMRAARGRPRSPNPRPADDARLGAGPGLVGQVLGVDRSFIDLCDLASPLHLAVRRESDAGPRIEAGPRIGIAYAGEPWTSRPWRLAVADSRALSRRIG
jgi:DNA-3-methyladenine glycosylase